jgi:hypothetical protein
MVDPAGGVLAEFATGLRRLREKAGSPGYRRLARLAHYSASTLSEAAAGRTFPTLAVTLAYVSACGGDIGEWEARWRSVAAHLAAAQSDRRDDTPTEDDQPSPYVGLAAFGVEDASRFFGRERLIDQLLATVARRRCLVVVGASGAGKSSLLRAGLLAQVRAGALTAGVSWPAVLFTPGQHPIQECAVALAGALGRSAGPLATEITADSDHLGLAVRQALHEQPDDVELLVVVDQFEEIFTLCHDREERDHFLTALLSAAGSYATNSWPTSPPTCHHRPHALPVESTNPANDPPTLRRSASSWRICPPDGWPASWSTAGCAKSGRLDHADSSLVGQLVPHDRP